MQIEVLQKVVLVILLGTLVVDEISAVPPVNAQLDIVGEEIDERVEDKHDHCSHDLHPDIFIPLRPKVRVLPNEVPVQEPFALIFHEVGTDEERQQDGINKETNEQSERNQHSLPSSQMEANYRENWSRDQGE
jgi:hypothetical protein